MQWPMMHIIFECRDSSLTAREVCALVQASKDMQVALVFSCEVGRSTSALLGVH